MGPKVVGRRETEASCEELESSTMEVPSAP